MVTKLRLPFSSMRSSILILQNFLVSADIVTVPIGVSRKMSGRCVLPVQSCCNLFEINQKYANSYISKGMIQSRKVSGPTISFPEKSRSAELHGKRYGNFGLLWNFLFGHVLNTAIPVFKQYSIDFRLYHVVLPHSDEFSCRELMDLRLIGRHHFDDPRGRSLY
jgi:hypothetical protein